MSCTSDINTDIVIVSVAISTCIYVTCVLYTVPIYSMYAREQNNFPEMDNKIKLNWIELNVTFVDWKKERTDRRRDRLNKRKRQTEMGRKARCGLLLVPVLKKLWLSPLNHVIMRRKKISGRKNLPDALYIFRPVTTTYCISCYFLEGFIFANFAKQNLVKMSTSSYVYL